MYRKFVLTNMNLQIQHEHNLKLQIPNTFNFKFHKKTNLFPCSAYNSPVRVHITTNLDDA